MKAPKHLKLPTRRWWESVVSSWELEEHHLRLLTHAAEAWDRAEQARLVVAKDGLTFKDKFGGIKPHPAVQIERDAKVLFSRLIRELDLDVEQPNEGRRPPALRAFRG